MQVSASLLMQMIKVIFWSFQVMLCHVKFNASYMQVSASARKNWQNLLHISPMAQQITKKITHSHTLINDKTLAIFWRE